MLSLLASVAQFEREIMLERQREGIARLRIGPVVMKDEVEHFKEVRLQE